MDRRLFLLAALAAGSACSGSQARPSTAAAPADSAAQVAAAPEQVQADSARETRRRRQRRDRNVITREEIDELGRSYTNLYDFIVSQHFDWLRVPAGARLSRGTRPLTVYMDGQRWGATPESMRTIALTSVHLVRRLSGGEAAGKYGLDNNSGTIEVFTSAESVR